ncbi:MAG: aminoacyl-tRNA hydrolase [Proteobacteria bacterium]|nr:aminoacyl-tRNA hydrolase [Pseudomonadota bacterium]MBU1388599.1 aminoacyl-tRNA hydrolase [Pseudomonadota bacterium]MBU1541755.1 aminoacyl-tRNA hydrolase [Pseudomonadota bacterium]MBU2429263.1 aminoacyl-tRNA hydrolase [Pseudomonadota bacterium]MBU2482345.1 aminoacyl-tRNA hydrolase [Pseudomonadota bacterium]
MSDSRFKIVAGLGNPGDGYAQTRHNIGFLVVEAIASKFSLSLDKSRFDSQYAKAKIGANEVFLIKPLSYMNNSGFPLQKFASYYKIDINDIIVIHDDMDLSFGQIKIVKSRGHGGHNGVRSILEVFGQKDCVRIRVGVGHPGSGKDITGHVLGRFSPDEIAVLDQCVNAASEACICALEKGVTIAMNRFNTVR